MKFISEIFKDPILLFGWLVLCVLGGMILLTLAIPIWEHMYGVIDAYWSSD